MKFLNFVSLLIADLKSRSFLSSFFILMSLISCAYFIGSVWMEKDYLMISPRLVLSTHKHIKCEVENGLYRTEEDTHNLKKCNDKCRPVGSESLPEGIVSSTSNLEMYPLTGPISLNNELKNRTSLLALAVGIKQKEVVNQIVTKFMEEEFVVMLFHYDGIVDEWRDMEWNDRVIHVSAINQTKWWFAKRFLHPDIVDEYQYIFLWDEDLGVDYFNPKRYISIIMEEGLEISQPALDPAKSKVHHQITVLNGRSRVHRRYYRPGRCDGHSTGPPCVGWVEMMAPVFSRAAWRCAWYMIQNDLIHAWGLDKQLGYCAQGDRTIKVGVVDEEYVLHLALPTLGARPHKDKVSSGLDNFDNRSAIRLRSYSEMRTFTHRWNKAVKDDQCWVDPFKPSRT